MGPAEARPLEAGRGGGERDVPGELAALRRRVEEARADLGEERLRERRAELEAEVARPDLWEDQHRAKAVTAELGKVNADLGLLEELGQRLADAEAAGELLEEEPDPQLSAELTESLEELGRRLDELELRSLFRGQYDEGDAIVELHAGAGGTDAQDWCEMLLRMYLRWAERRGFDVEVDEVSPGQEAGILSATFVVKGRFAYGLLQAERGVHRLVRISPFDAQHRRQTSFASVDVTPMVPEDAEVAIDERDLRVDTYRSSGAGGQHVNKTDSAVRITHLPTGIVVSCQNERSQHQNRARAMQILASKLAALAEEQRRAELAALSGPKVDVAWGNQTRNYVLAPYQLVKDLRTGLETGNVEAVLDGDLDRFIEAELRRRRREEGDQEAGRAGS
ncbi:peptide chain release factor 2 [Aciditerrimonas ferrireducens]|uniref:peptide chain release factor 2 n=1 Tax=Aciditerrimonas ferrireducens TaxID=667306 RepID=UPI0020057878|nr:peptide chain release factor 2 [Aciditerrimonas ferrireducens]MCK4177440.1 peptide chain release factor 2 [Aciditerrimonas ferrireducens]